MSSKLKQKTWIFNRGELSVVGYVADLASV